MSDQQKNNRLNAVAVAVVAITFVVYLPALTNGFVNWDDQLYVYDNKNIQQIDFEFFKWSITGEVAALWHPFTLLSLAADHAIWGLNPAGYHLTNIIIHSLNTLLVYILLVKVLSVCRNNLSIPYAAALPAILFGIHPMHVESVAWVSERKDVLSAFFSLCSLIAYLAYANRGSRRLSLYCLCLFFYIMALLSKPMAVTLPFIFLILDYYPLNRIRLERGTADTSSMLIEKIPFFLFGIMVAIITIIAHSHEGAMASIETSSIMVRIFNAVKAYIYYLYKLLLPINLSPLYPYGKNVLKLEYICSFILFALICVCIVLSKKRFYIAVWSYYLITLIPVIGLIQVGAQFAADRYTYMPSLGPFLLLGVGGAHYLKRYSQEPEKTFILWILIFSITVIFAIKTIKQIGIWHDPLSLWSHQLKVVPSTAFNVYNNLGQYYLESGKIKEAIGEYNMAIEINSEEPEVYYNRGTAYARAGRLNDALSDFTRAIELSPGFSSAYINRGNIYRMTGNYESAISDFKKAIEYNGDFAEAYYNIGSLYQRVGDIEKSRYYMEKASSLGLILK